MAKEPKNVCIEKSYANAYREQRGFNYDKVKRQDETEKWGRAEVRDDHPEIRNDQTIPKAKDASEPQFKNDKMASRGVGDVPNNWVRGFGAGQAEGKPAFDKYQVKGRSDDCGRAPTPQPPRRLKPLPAK